MRSACASLVACLAVLTGSAAAQVAHGAMGGMSHFAPRPAPANVIPQRSITSFGHAGFHHPNRFGPIYGGFPLWWGDWDDGYPSNAAPQVVVMQGGQGAAPEPGMHWEDAPKSSAPLLIELQGDRYVRISGQSSPETPAGSTAEPPRTLAEMNAAEAVPAQRSAALAPTVFVFRDGHREESNDYSIVGATIYASSNYWESGSWNTQIPVSELDIPATQRANEDHGVRFVLPSGPNEVVTRP